MGVYILCRCVYLGCLHLCGNDSSVCVSELCVCVCVCVYVCVCMCMCMCIHSHVCKGPVCYISYYHILKQATIKTIHTFCMHVQHT